MKRLAVLLVLMTLLVSACELDELFRAFEIEDITNADDPAVRAAAISDSEGRADIKAEEAINRATETRDLGDALEAERLRPGDSRYIAYTLILSSYHGDSAGMEAATGRLYEALVYDHPGADEETIRRLAYQQTLDAQLQIIQAQDIFPGREALLQSYCYRAIGGLDARFDRNNPEVQEYFDHHVPYWICH